MRLYQVKWPEADVLRHFGARIKGEMFLDACRSIIDDESEPQLGVMEVPRNKEDLIAFLDAGCPATPIAEWDKAHAGESADDEEE